MTIAYYIHDIPRCSIIDIYGRTQTQPFYFIGFVAIGTENINWIARQTYCYGMLYTCIYGVRYISVVRYTEYILYTCMLCIYWHSRSSCVCVYVFNKVLYMLQDYMAVHRMCTCIYICIMYTASDTLSWRSTQ